MFHRPLAAAAALLLVASCSSDGSLTRPTLPSRTTVAVSEPGATAPGATDPPAIETTAPATDPPVTEPGATTPVTPAPTTAAPVTVPPETAPPATNAPATDPPVTLPVTVPGSEPVVDGDGGDDDGTLWWLLLLLGAVVLVGGIVVVLRRRGPAWSERVTPLLQEIDAVAGRLSVHTPDGLRAVAAAEAASLASLRARLADLVEDARDDSHRSTLDALTGPLAELHAAVGVVALAPVAPSPDQQQAVVRGAAVVHATSATARVTLLPPSSSRT
jgi:hypothetical protein